MNLREQYEQLTTERGFSADPVQRAVIARLDELRERLIAARPANSTLLHRLVSTFGNSRRLPEKGLYLWGGVGRGKTWMMDLFYQSLPFPERRRRHFHRFMYEVHAELRDLHDEQNPLELVAERIARDTRVLCFDELFVSDIGDAMILGGLFRGLFERGVTLVATSNVSPRDLYRDGLQRQRFIPAIELIEEYTEVLPVTGATDFRLRSLTQAGTYLLSSAADTPQRLAALFEDLAGHGRQESGSIEILGRPIPVVCLSENVVWFGFNAICAGPRSSNDYIEIARAYQSVFVSDVPILDGLKENEARRFIALVDEMYDRRVNLVVSAAAPPHELYRGETLRMEFQRTVSRLIEMQSEEYLASEHRP